MNRNLKTTGIVLRKFDLKEVDRIITVLTDEYGKIDCIAKGARRLKSKFCGRLELFNEVRLECFQGKSSLMIINEATMLSHLEGVKELRQHRVLFYMAEITHKLIQEGQQIQGVYPLLRETLHLLEENQKTEVILHTYLIKLLTLIGFLSPWNQCATCNEKLATEQPIFLSMTDANVVCTSCKQSADRQVELSFVKWVNFMQQYPLPEVLKVQSSKEHQAVWQWLEGVLSELLTSPVKSADFMRA